MVYENSFFNKSATLNFEDLRWLWTFSWILLVSQNHSKYHVQLLWAVQKQIIELYHWLTFSPDFGSYIAASAVPAAAQIVLIGLT